jgi:dolichyl-phosphate beta-glucosyltransferase
VSPAAPQLSIVIPAYEEERRLPATLAGWQAFLDGHAGEAEVVVVDDGSRDGTAVVVERAARQDRRIRLLRLDANQGKGGAVRAGMLASRGAYRFYVDADLNIAPTHVTPALELLRGGADLVVGRRDLREYAREEQSLARLAAGLAVQVARRVIVLPVFSDTQAGFKGFRAAFAERVFAAAEIRSFAFDIEVLFLARRLGARIVEMPVSVEYRAGSRYSLRRHLPVFLRDIVGIRRRALAGRYR